MDLIITVSSLSPEKLTLSLENASLQEHSCQSSPISTCIVHQFSSCLISHRRRYTLGFSQRQSFHFCCGPVSPLPFTRMLLLFFPPFSLASSICLSLLDHYWRRKWQPTLVSLPGKSHGQRSLAGCSPLGCKESDTTE